MVVLIFAGFIIAFILIFFSLMVSGKPHFGFSLILPFFIICGLLFAQRSELNIIGEKQTTINFYTNGIELYKDEDSDNYSILYTDDFKITNVYQIAELKKNEYELLMEAVEILEELELVEINETK